MIHGINGTLGDNWGAETSPSGYDLMYAQSMDQIAPGIVDYAQSIRTASESIIDAINRARLSVAMTDAQRELLAVQVQRAQQGLPPINTQVYTGAGGITAGTILGMPAQTFMMLALAAIGVYLLSKRR